LTYGDRLNASYSSCPVFVVLVYISQRKVVMNLYKKAKEALQGNDSLIPTNFIDKLEDIVHGFLGILLFIIAALAAIFTLKRLIETEPFFPTGMIQGVNDILLVVIILEIRIVLALVFALFLSRSARKGKG